MPDVHTEVKRTGWGKNIVKSIIGVFVGGILFIASFVILWNSEGRVNIGKVAEESIVIQPDAAKSSAQARLVSLTGPIETTQKVGDPDYLKPGAYVVLYRSVEMYAWIEESETKTEKKTGGSTEEKTTYTYKKGWTAHPQKSSDFKIPEGHDNPSMSVSPEIFYAPQARIGIYSFDHKTASLPSPKPVYLNQQNAIAHWDADLVGKDYIYKGKSSYEHPIVGDLRISFKAVNAGTKVTLFGKLENREITAYYHKGKTRLYRAIAGTRDEAINLLKTEHKVMGWILRIVGFILMWIGLTMIFGPISVFLDVCPFLGSISRGLIGVITFIIALVLTLITILISMIFHNIVALIILVIVAIAIVYLLIGRKKKAAKT